MDCFLKTVNINNIGKQLLPVIILLSLFLVPAFYFQCYYRQGKIVNLYCTVINDFFTQTEKKTASMMLITENAYGVNQDVEEQIITCLGKHDIRVIERAIPPYLDISSAIATDQKLAEWIKAVICRRLSVKVYLMEKLFDLDAKEVNYQMRYSKGKWRIE